jgi:hypothetical protein
VTERMPETKLVLPFLRAPSKDVQMTESRLVAMPRSEAMRIDGWIIYGFETQAYFREPPEGNPDVAVLDVKHAPATRTHYTLVDLISGNWEYIVERTFARKRQDVIEVVPPTDRRLTPTMRTRLDRGLALLRSNRRFRIATDRWGSAIERFDPLDSVLDCCAALEAVFELRDELRLRLAFAARYSVQRNRSQAFRRIYEMYGVRSAFVHGSAPRVSDDDQRAFLRVVHSVLCGIVARGKVPSGEDITKGILALV